MSFAHILADNFCWGYFGGQRISCCKDKINLFFSKSKEYFLIKNNLHFLVYT